MGEVTTVVSMSGILSGTSDVLSTVGNIVGYVANTIASNPLLLLGAVALPIISFGTGLLIRVFHRA